jgi:hypothetical protein
MQSSLDNLLSKDLQEVCQSHAGLSLSAMRSRALRARGFDAISDWVGLIGLRLISLIVA